MLIKHGMCYFIETCMLSPNFKVALILLLLLLLLFFVVVVVVVLFCFCGFLS